MSFNIQTKVVIQSATLELAGEQLRELAMASTGLDAIISRYQKLDGEQHGSLAYINPARELLNSIAKLMRSVDITPAAGKNRLSPEGIAKTQAKAAERKAAKYAARPDPDSNPEAWAQRMIAEEGEI